MEKWIEGCKLRKRERGRFFHEVRMLGSWQRFETTGSQCQEQEQWALELERKTREQTGKNAECRRTWPGTWKFSFFRRKEEVWKVYILYRPSDGFYLSWPQTSVPVRSPYDHGFLPKYLLGFLFLCLDL